MKTAAIAPAKIRIRAPNAEAAFALEARLAHDGVPAGVQDVWTVELESATNGLEEIEAEVRRWLQDLRLPSTVVSVCGRDRTIEIELSSEGNRGSRGTAWFPKGTPPSSRSWRLWACASPGARSRLRASGRDPLRAFLAARRVVRPVVACGHPRPHMRLWLTRLRPR